MVERRAGPVPRPDRATLVAFAFVVFAGGSNFVAVSVNVDEMPPFWGAAVRFSAAGALLLGLMALRRVSVPRGSALAAALVFGVLNFGAFYALMYWALQEVPAGMASIVIASAPLLTILLAVAHRIERFRLRGMLGALLALTGIGVMYARAAGSGLDLPRLVAVAVAALCLAEAGVVAKRWATGGPVATNAIGMPVGALLLFVASIVAGEVWAAPTRSETWLSLVYLVLVGSVALFLGLLFVLERWTVSATSFVTVLFPVVAVGLDAALGRQDITPAVVVGGVLVMSGVWVGALAPEGWLRRRAVQATAPAD